MKRKLILTVLALIVATALFGCGKGNLSPTFTLPAQDEETSHDAEESADIRTETQTEPAEINWSYSLVTETLEREYDSDEGVHLASVSCERPVLELVSDADSAGAKPPKDMQNICDVFNEKFESLYSESFVENTCDSAKKLYDEIGEENRSYFNAFKDTVTVKDPRIEGDLVELVIEHYGYWGGVHGGASRTGYHFDLMSGSFFDLSYVTDDISGMNEAIGNEIFSQISEKGEQDHYNPGYYDTIRNYTNFNFALGDDSLTVIFGEYEIAAYAAGMPEFEVSYGEISRYLNEDGERLLKPSAESKVMGNFHEAFDMWYWFEGMLPVDYSESITVKRDGNELNYARVDIPGADSINDVRNMMLTRMTEELADARLDKAMNDTDYPMFCEADGKLYGMVWGRGGDMRIRSINYRAEIDPDGRSGRVIATITWQDYDEDSGDWVLTGETSDFEYPFVIKDGGAVFTEFHTLW